MNTIRKKISNASQLREKVITFSSSFEDVVILDSFLSSGSKKDFKREKPFIAAIGAEKRFIEDDVNWDELDQFINNAKDDRSWIFGCLSYDLKNSIEKLQSENNDRIGFPNICFFIPKILIFIDDDHIELNTVNTDSSNVLQAIEETDIETSTASVTENYDLISTLTHEEYLKKIEKLLHHIQRGDIYEANFCQEFFQSDVKVNATQLYIDLSHRSPNPFGCYLKLNDKYLLSASPERYLRKQGDKLISQPIKGTRPRSDDPGMDESLKEELLNSIKDRSENVMIVDLVRNDFSKVASRGSVNVDELFGIHSFPGVHQMISTVSCILKKNTSFSDIIRATFPMGSMTGAPKMRAMELIEELETMKRGLFSGSVGYIDPDGNFDWNVVIRSILYNHTQRTISIMAGGAITTNSIPEDEYQETLTKLGLIFELLGVDLPTLNQSDA
jgi:para-aminobenzoate synthetase component 1